MTVEGIREIAQRIRSFAEFAQGEYISYSVRVENDYYSVDLGAFGEQEMSVSIEDDNYQLDADNVLDKFPITSGDFFEIAEELEGFEAPEPEEVTLETVLERMENTGDVALVQALRSTVQAFRDAVSQAASRAVSAALAAVPLPPKPLPWPGALRMDVDYTAPDFPMRYQPPPGYDWTRKGPYASAGLPYQDAVPYEVGVDGLNDGQMLMDIKGRVSWRNRGDDELKDGLRWPVWFLGRDGIPPANGQFDGATLPLAIDENGDIIGEWLNTRADGRIWNSDTDTEIAKRRLLEIRNATSEKVSLSYDPLTVTLDAASISVPTRELRVGDDVTGEGFGRVVSVDRLSNGNCLVKMNRNGRININDEYNDSMTWDVLPIIGVERGAQPTALSLSNGAPSASVDYDPLTVPLVQTEVLLASSDLRLGDDIRGDGFGRVVAIENGEIVMNRDNTENRTLYKDTFKWQVFMIDVPNRDSVPTAASLQLATV